MHFTFLMHTILGTFHISDAYSTWYMDGTVAGQKRRRHRENDTHLNVAAVEEVLDLLWERALGRMRL